MRLALVRFGFALIAGLMFATTPTIATTGEHNTFRPDADISHGRITRLVGQE